MAFSDFDLKTARERFGLTTDEGQDLFSGMPTLDVPDLLREILDRWAPAALAMNIEKARSELIIAPILMEAIRLARPPVNLFSGAVFDVDKEQGLNGACDYLITRSSERYSISQPLVAVAEAKKEDIVGGLGQCVAVMVAVRIFNERERSGPHIIHGIVTSGTNWRFLKLQNSVVLIDLPEYYLEQVGKILGILVSTISAGDS
jgi:hypothetical protein